MEIHESGPIRLIVNEKSVNFGFGDEYRAFYREGDNRLFRFYEHDDITLSGFQSIYADGYFYDIIIRQAMRELNEYLDEHMEDREYWRSREFWQYALYSAGRPVIPTLPRISYKELDQDHVKFYSSIFSESDLTCYYDLASELLCLEQADDTAPYYLARHLYGESKLMQILAQRQHEAFGLPHPYEELCRINDFMVDKRMVRLHFVGGAVTRCYERKNLNAREVLTIEYGKIVPHSYNYRTRISSKLGLPVKLTHRKNEYLIDTAALGALEVELTQEEIDHIKKEKYLKWLKSMIPPGKRVSYSHVRMWANHRMEEEFFTTQTGLTNESLLEMDEARRFCKANCTASKITIDATVITYGSGELAEMPNELLEIIRKEKSRPLPVSNLELLKAEVDGSTLTERYFDDKSISNEQRRIFLERKLLAATDRYSAITFSIVTVKLEQGEKTALYRCLMEDDADVANSALLQRVRWGYPYVEQFKVSVWNITIGNSYKQIGISDDLLALVKEYGIEETSQLAGVTNLQYRYEIEARHIFLDQRRQQRLERLRQLYAPPPAIEENPQGKQPNQAGSPRVDALKTMSLDKLQHLLAQLEYRLNVMQDANEYFMINGTLFGCTGISDQEAEKLYAKMDDKDPWDAVPFPVCEVTSTRVEIRGVREQINFLQATQAEDSDWKQQSA